MTNTTHQWRIWDFNEGATRVEGVMEGLGLPPKNFFSPQNDNFDAVFNRQKPWGTDFTVQLRNEAYKNSAKIIQKFTVRPRGRSHNRLAPTPEY